MLSVVVCSRDEARFAPFRSHLEKLLAGERFELCRIADARSMAEGCNRGAGNSRGDLILFCHDDIEILTPDFARLLRRHLERFDLIGVAGTNRLSGPQWVQSGPPHLFGQVAHLNPAEQAIDVVIWNAARRAFGGIEAMDGVLLCARRAVWEAIPFDERTFDGFHLYDLDFTLRAHRHGFKLGVCADLPLLHASHGNFDDAWRQSAMRFVEKHQSQFRAVPPRRWSTTIVQVRTKAEAIEVMNPGCWDDAEPHV